MEAEQKAFNEHIKQYEALLNSDPDARDPDAVPMVCSIFLTAGIWFHMKPHDAQ